MGTSSVSEPSLRQLVGRLRYRQLGLLVGIGNVASAQRRPTPLTQRSLDEALGLAINPRAVAFGLGMANSRARA